MKSKEEIDAILERWRLDDREDIRLAEKVWARIRESEEPERIVSANRFGDWWSGLMKRPAYALAMAAAFALFGFVAGNVAPSLLNQGGEDSVDAVYRESIDPLMRVESGYADAATSANLRAPATLTWLKQELGLDSGQFEKVVLLHSLYESEFEKLFGKLMETKTKFQEMEERRFKDDVIDFFSVYDLVKRQEGLEKTSNELKSELLVKLGEVMEPDQWKRYQSLVEPAVEDGSVKMNDV